MDCKIFSSKNKGTEEDAQVESSDDEEEEESEEEKESVHSTNEYNGKNKDYEVKPVKHVRIMDNENKEILSPTRSDNSNDKVKKKPDAKKSKLCIIL